MRRGVLADPVSSAQQQYGRALKRALSNITLLEGLEEEGIEPEYRELVEETLGEKDGVSLSCETWKKSAFWLLKELENMGSDAHALGCKILTEWREAEEEKVRRKAIIILSGMKPE